MIKKEQEVINFLVRAWNKFLELETQHPNDIEDFGDGIHKCEYIIGMRVARKHESKTFPIKR